MFPDWSLKKSRTQFVAVFEIVADAAGGWTLIQVKYLDLP